MDIWGGKMILIKCNNKKCSKKFSKEDIETLKVDVKKIGKKCPICKAKKLTWNITEKSARKRWYGYLNADKLNIEYLVLLIIDEFDDNSIEVEIPLLQLVFSTDNMLTVHGMASKAIHDYLEQNFGKTYATDHQFVTSAFCEETDSVKYKVPVWW
jgi:hypothetical protein